MIIYHRRESCDNDETTNNDLHSGMFQMKQQASIHYYKKNSS